MTREQLLQKIRLMLDDINAEEQLYSDEELLNRLEDAAAAYSAYRPIKRRVTIDLIKGENPLPEDYQIWLEGLENFVIYGQTLYSDYAIGVTFVYLANRMIEEIPFQDIALLMDYAFAGILENAVSAAGDISSLKLGKGLQLSFDNIAEVNKLALSKRDSFIRALTAVQGSWC